MSALAHHGLTTQIPHAVDVALPSHARVPQSCPVPLHTYWFQSRPIQRESKRSCLTRSHVAIHTAEKTIADCFKYRNKVGIAVAIEALLTYRDITKRPNYKALVDYAGINRVQRVMRPYLDAILWAAETSALRSGSAC